MKKQWKSNKKTFCNHFKKLQFLLQRFDNFFDDSEVSDLRSPCTNITRCIKQFWYYCAIQPLHCIKICTQKFRNSFELFNFDDVDFADCTSSNALSQISNIVDERLPLKVYTLKSFLLRQKQTLRSIWMS